MAPLVDPRMDLEDERPTPVGSPLSAVDECMPLSPRSGMDVEVVHALLEVFPEMVTPIVDPAVGFSITPATYPVPPVPMMWFGNSIPLEVASPAGLAVGSPAWSEIPLRRVSSPASVASSGLPPSSSVLRPAPDVGPPSGLAAMDQELSWSASTLLPAHLTLSRMVEGVVVPGSVWSSPAGGTDVAGGPQRLPDLSLEGPFDVHQDRPVLGASPRVLDGMRGCQYRMTSYDQDSGGPDFSPAHTVARPRLLRVRGCARVGLTAQP